MPPVSITIDWYLQLHTGPIGLFLNNTVNNILITSCYSICSDGPHRRRLITFARWRRHVPQEQISKTHSGFCVQQIIKFGSFLTGLFKVDRGGIVFTRCRSSAVYVHRVDDCNKTRIGPILCCREWDGTWHRVYWFDCTRWRHKSSRIYTVVRAITQSCHRVTPILQCLLGDMRILKPLPPFTIKFTLYQHLLVFHKAILVTSSM